MEQHIRLVWFVQCILVMKILDNRVKENSISYRNIKIKKYMKYGKYHSMKSANYFFSILSTKDNYCHSYLSRLFSPHTSHTCCLIQPALIPLIPFTTHTCLPNHNILISLFHHHPYASVNFNTITHTCTPVCC